MVLPELFAGTHPYREVPAPRTVPKMAIPSHTAFTKAEGTAP